MKRIISLFVLIIGLILINPTFVSAHILQSSGSVGAVLHIDPNDEPIAKQPSNFFFEFKDTKNKFSGQNCDCTVSILENGQTIYSGALFDANATNLSAYLTYTFPQKDVYTIKIIGNPRSSNDFDPFTLQYDVRVAQEAADSATSQTQAAPTWLSQHWVQLLPFIILIIIGIFVFLNSIKKNKGKEVKE